MALDDRTDLSRLRLAPDEKRTGGSRARLVLVAGGVGAVVLGAVALAVAVTGDSGDDGEGEGPSRPARAARAAARRPNEVAAGGYVEARRTARVLPGRDGVVAAVHAELGQGVDRGSLLLELENRTDAAEVEMARAEVDVARSRLRRVRSGSRLEEVEAAGADTEAAEAALEEARRDRERLEALLPQGAIAAADVDRARQRERGSAARVKALRAREQLLRRGSRQADVLAAEAELARAEASLRRAEARLEVSKLRAPFDATVVGVDVRPGEVISLQAGTGGISLADLSELWVRVDVPETRVVGVRLGASASVVVDALGADPLEASVIEIAPQADRQSNTVEVAVRIAEPPEAIRPNMSARVTIEARGEER